MNEKRPHEEIAENSSSIVNSMLRNTEYALLNMATPGLFKHTLSMMSNIFDVILQNTMGDIPFIFLDPEKFITTDLYNRAAETGIAQAYVGPKFLCDYGLLPTITIVNGDRALVAQVTKYDDEDPVSREPFKILEDLSGVKSIVNKTGDEAAAERKLIKIHLSGNQAIKKAYTFTLSFIKNYFQQWDDKICVQDHITYISSNIIGFCVFGIPHVPMQYAKLLQDAGRLVVHPKPPEQETKRIARLIKLMSDDLMSHKDMGYLKGYPLLQLKLTGDESHAEVLQRLKALNAGADIVVEGNLSFLILSGILLINQKPEILTRLRNELKDFDWQQDNAYDELCQLNYLDCVYTELLRHPSPTGMLARQVSHPYTLEGNKINGSKAPCNIAGNSRFSRFFGNSHMVVCVSSIHHDPRYWTKPDEFNPSRFEGAEGKILKEKYIMPFSVGKRSCPAGSTDGMGFAATVGKLAIAYFITHYHLDLKSELKSVANDTFYRRWEKIFASIHIYAEERDFRTTESTAVKNRF